MSLNTTQIGNEFERRVAAAFTMLMRHGALGIDPSYAKIISKPNYFSRDRLADIIFDLAIEVWPKGAERCSFLFLIECKKLSRKVSADDIEEFHSKMGQMSGVAVKGVLVTNKGFDPSTYQLARSWGIMLVLCNDKKDPEVLLHKRLLDQSRIMYGPEHSLAAEIESLVTKIDDRILSAFLEPEFSLKNLSKKDIRLIAEAELNKINPAILRQPPTALSYQRLERYIKETLSAEIHLLPSDVQQLGGYNAMKNIFYLNSSLGTNRRLFVLAHEFGHHVLHRNLQIDQNIYEAFSDPEFNFRTNKYDFENPKHWIEWQANYFASSLAVPVMPLIWRLYEYQFDANLRPGKLYVDDQYCNVQAYQKIIKKLAYFFDVSQTTVIYKLKELDWIENGSRLKRLNDIILEWNSDTQA